MRLLCVLLVSLAIGQAQATPTPPAASSPSARVAAVHFAIANGWQFPKTNVIVAVETDYHRGATGPPCYAKSDVAIVEVSEVLVGETDVRLAVYWRGPGPADPPKMTQAVIVLERRDKNWIGVRYSMEPKTLTGKR